MIVIWTGMPGSGKTTKLADVTLKLLRRNIKWYVKSGVKRYIYSNIKFDDDFLETYYKGIQFKDFVKYWKTLEDVESLRDVDLIWQEVAAYLDNTQWEKIDLNLKRWLQLHRHYGVDIYGDTQDFSTIVISFRRLVNQVFQCVKLLGSRDKSPTRPPVRWIWGLVAIREVDQSSFREEKEDFKYVGFPSFFWIDRDLCSVFDSYADLKYDKYPPLKHIPRQCLVCDKKTIIHR